MKGKIIGILCFKNIKFFYLRAEILANSDTNHLVGLYEMFPNESQVKIRTIWKKSKFNVREAINVLIQESLNKPTCDTSDTGSSPDSKISKYSSNSSSKSSKRKLEGKGN